jgi:uncharacterized protein YlxW (UPF0749 family)
MMKRQNEVDRLRAQIVQLQKQYEADQAQIRGLQCSRDDYRDEMKLEQVRARTWEAAHAQLAGKAG